MVDTRERVAEWYEKRGVKFYHVYIKFGIDENGGPWKEYMTSSDVPNIYRTKRDSKAFLTNPELIDKQYQEWISNKSEILNRTLDYKCDKYDVMVVLCSPTHVYYQIDCDSEKWNEHFSNHPVVKNLPRYESATKGYYHIIFTAKNFNLSGQSSTSYERVEGVDKGFDILHGSGAFFSHDAIMENADCENIEIDFIDFIKDYTQTKDKDMPPRCEIKTDLVQCNNVVNDKVPKSFYENHRLFKLCQCLNIKRFDDRNEWLNVGFALHSSKYAYAFNIWRHFSAKSDRYDDAKFEEGGEDRKRWDGFKYMESGGISVGSLVIWAKLDNYEKYAELCGVSYDDLKKKFELSNFKVNFPVSFVEEIDGKLSIMTRKDFITRHENLHFDAKVKKNQYTSQSFVNEWLKDPTLRCYDRMVFDPSPNVSDRYYNTYKGLAVNSIEDAEVHKDYVNIINTFVKTQLCGDDEDFFNFFIYWCASIVQKPWEKTQVCIIIKSVEGIGKNLFINFLGEKILGYFWSTATIKNAIGDFNGKLENLLLLNLNEVHYKDTCGKQGKLNEYITDNKIDIRRMRTDPYDVQNRLNIIGTTNNDCPFPIGHSDRRYACVESKAKKLSDKTAKAMVDIFEDENAIYSYYQYLNNIELPKERLPFLRPITSFYKECKILSSSILTCFWSHYLRGLPELKSHFMSYESLYMMFNEWSDNNHRQKEPMKRKSFDIAICKYPYVSKKRDKKGGRDIMGLWIEAHLLLSHFRENNDIEDDDEYDFITDEDIKKADEEYKNRIREEQKKNRLL